MVEKFKQRLKNQRGFTLVELLAVIVILGIIAAIAVPSIGNIIAKSKHDGAKADAIAVLNAAKLYVAETGESNVTTAIDATSKELDPYINGDDVTQLASWSITIVDGVPKIDATAVADVKVKGGGEADFDGTVAEVNKLEYDRGTDTTEK